VTFLQPRRFAECWQADAEWPGTIEQQQTVRDAFALVYGKKFWAVMKRLDYSANQVYQRHYLTVGFPPDDMFGMNQSAIAGVSGINFRASYAVGAIIQQARHELGHVVDKHLLSQTQRVWFMHQITGPDLGNNRWTWNYQETFADAFRDWVNSDGGKWESLTPILTEGGKL